jgi:CRISPR-associated endonuclease/helicase Cas3
MSGDGNTPGPLAHIGISGEPHQLAEHLRAVSTLASDFGEFMGSSAWAAFAGLWHDLGKYRAGFQTYIRQAQDPNAHIEGRIGGRDKTHSAAGAFGRSVTFPSGRVSRVR